MQNYKKDDITERLVQYVLTLDTQELSTLNSQKVAETFGMNSNEIRQAFISSLELTLEQFIIREKLYRAFYIIENDREISLSHLAKEMGFFNLKDFEKEFESLLLIHPARYKELLNISH